MRSAPFQNVAHGTPDALREFIHEHLGLAVINAQVGMSFAEAGDDVGLEYAVRRLAAYTRIAINTLVELKVTKAATGSPAAKAEERV
jgi:hypothetical protein